MTDRTVGRVEANGVDFAYIEEGDQGAPLALCLHGFPDHAPTYDALLPELAAAGFHAVAPWTRGYAPTSVPADGRYQTAALALDALALADHFAPAAEGSAVLIGHDWGASASYLACTHRPARFDRLVAMALPHTAAMIGRFLFDGAALKGAWHVFFFQLAGIPEASVAANDFAIIDYLWQTWSPVPPPADYMRKLKDTLGSPGSLEAAIGYYRAMFNPSAHDPALAEVQAKAFNPIEIPTLYIHGEQDGALASNLAPEEELKKLFPAGLEREIVEGAGHFAHRDRPDEVNRRIMRFLTER